MVAATLERDQLARELARLGMELAACQNEIARLRARSAVGAAARRAAPSRSARQTCAPAKPPSAKLTEAIARIAEMRQAAQAQQEELAARRAEKAGLDERLASAAAIAARIEEERRELPARAAALGRSASGHRRRATATLAAPERRAAAADRIAARRTPAPGSAKDRARAGIGPGAGRAPRKWTTPCGWRARNSTELREERSRHEVERARNDAEREHLRDACLNELNAQPEDLIAEQPALLGGEELAAADTQYHEMKSRVESMGPVNMMALEEYNECEQRFVLPGTRARGPAAIHRRYAAGHHRARPGLPAKIRGGLCRASTRISPTAFQTLFGGGTGQMRLSEPDSAGEAGIDIAAQPPGKRLQNVLLLSGGEKALTALALLIAIFRYQPSPFCILDEVDAPLDETNVGRFAQMVAEMSGDAQFIVVTHNRRTMEMASVLYGVTMQEPGVSKLVSVNWEQARAAAASNAA